VYDANHFFHQIPEKIYSPGTKNKDLKLNPDGALTLSLRTGCLYQQPNLVCC
jgi:hypothetical protein